MYKQPTSLYPGPGFCRGGLRDKNSKYFLHDKENNPACVKIILRELP